MPEGTLYRRKNMGSLLKQRKRYEAEKMAKQVMNTPSFKETLKEQEIRATTNAIARLAFIACEFLENNHGYKKVGLKKFLKYLLDCLEYTGTDDEFFITHEKYYKEMMGLDVLAELGLALEEKA
jgi:hypothetical protein